jgi:hypothetical protein
MSLLCTDMIETAHKLVGSLLNVISRDFKNLFIPVNKPSGLHKQGQLSSRKARCTYVLAYDSIAGFPSNTMTRSAIYVAMI